MGVTTVGSDQALLQLFALYQEATNKPVDPMDVWQKIASYVRNGGKYRFYPLDECDAEQPGGRFLMDFALLVNSGLLVRTDDDAVRVTDLAHFLCCGRSLPPSLSSLAEDIVRNNGAKV